MTVPPVGALGRTEQPFADALCGPDGTGDPSVLTPVLQTFPDALAAPMPDAMVAVPPLDVAAVLAAAGRSTSAAANTVVAPSRQAGAGTVAQPGRYGRTPSAQRPVEQAIPRPAPSARGTLQPRSTPQPRGALQPRGVLQPRGALQPRSAAAPRAQVSRPQQPQRPPGPASSAWSGQLATPGDVANLLRSTFSGIATAGRSAAAPVQPAAHTPTPPLPRRAPRQAPPPRRNKGSSIWAVLLFLIVIAFASGIAQQIFHAISQWLGR